MPEEDNHGALEAVHQAGRRMLAVTEEELQRLILDIHDGAVQKLFAVASHLALLQAKLDDHPPELRTSLEPSLTRSTLLLESALQDIRMTLTTFRMAEFQCHSLPEVLQGLAQQHEMFTGHLVDLQICGSIPDVSLPVKIALYRVLQEGLSNAYRHAGVDRSEVLLSSQDELIVLEVSDHGRGFEPPPLDGPGATEREEHIGLRGMRERILLVGGHLQVVSQPGQGTRIIVQVPYDG